jgi:hypothetical protein
MKWTARYFQSNKKKWDAWSEEKMDVDESLFSKGLKSYAYKQADIWARLKSRAVEVFKSSLGLVLSLE